MTTEATDRNREDLFWTLDKVNAQPHEIDLVIEKLANYTFDGRYPKECLLGVIGEYRGGSYSRVKLEFDDDDHIRFDNFENRFIMDIRWWLNLNSEQTEPAQPHTNARARLLTTWLKEYVAERF